MLLVAALAICATVAFTPTSALAEVQIYDISSEDAAKLSSEIIGIGGGGALFDPAISPHDSNEMAVRPDMGGVYISHDKGLHWDRANLYGTALCLRYDPMRPGVIYAGGSGLWRSTDYGRNFEMIFPREDDLIGRYTFNENALQYLFTESKVYDQNKYVKDVLVDPANPDHLFVLSFASKKGQVYESWDNGETFARLFTYDNNAGTGHTHFEFNELIFKRETGEVFAICDDGVFAYDRASGTVARIYAAHLADVSTVFEGGKTQFLVSEYTDTRADADTIVYFTSDFNTRNDITDILVSSQPTHFSHKTYGEVTYKYKFRYLSATSTTNIYAANWCDAQTSSIKPYPYPIGGIIRYDGTSTRYLYGNPFRDHNYLTERNWSDGNSYALGLTASATNPDEFLYTTLTGVVYSPDCIHLYPRYSTVTEGKFPNCKYVTSGIDEQTTYAVYHDPFNHDNVLLLNTDLGLVRSEDGGKSWVVSNGGIPGNWSNTIYDAAYDEKTPGLVYSIWSGRHDAPYSTGNETDNRAGGFAISYDGGATWDPNYSTGLPATSIPVKMKVVRQSGGSGNVDIYVAVFNQGFYVSHDSGRTFTEMNQGISRVSYKDDDNYRYIFGADIEVANGRIFGMTANSNYGGATQAGQVLEYVNGRWEALPLPANFERPRDILYHNGTLYVCGVPKGIWKGSYGGFIPVDGGVYKYENGAFTQIFDGELSTTSILFDARETMFISDMNGNIYRKEAAESAFTKIYDSYHYRSKTMQLTDNDDTIYMAAMGGGVLKLTGLQGLYAEEPPKNNEEAVKPPAGGNSSNSANVGGTSTNTNVGNGTNMNTGNASASVNNSAATNTNKGSSTNTNKGTATNANKGTATNANTNTNKGNATNTTTNANTGTLPPVANTSGNASTNSNAGNGGTEADPSDGNSASGPDLPDDGAISGDPANGSIIGDDLEGDGVLTGDGKNPASGNGAGETQLPSTGDLQINTAEQLQEPDAATLEQGSPALAETGDASAASAWAMLASVACALSSLSLHMITRSRRQEL